MKRLVAILVAMALTLTLAGSALADPMMNSTRENPGAGAPPNVGVGWVLQRGLYVPPGATTPPPTVSPLMTRAKDWLLGITVGVAADRVKTAVEKAPRAVYRGVKRAHREMVDNEVRHMNEPQHLHVPTF